MRRSSSSLPPPSDRDLVGPPDKLSNLRPVRLFRPPPGEEEGEAAARLRTAREDTHRWSHEFWADHNTQFNQVWFDLKVFFTI